MRSKKSDTADHFMMQQFRNEITRQFVAAYVVTAVDDFLT